jgi:hypothetical protein
LETVNYGCNKFYDTGPWKYRVEIYYLAKIQITKLKKGENKCFVGLELSACKIYYLFKQT